MFLSRSRMFIMTLPGARDLWASHLRERSVAFGTRLGFRLASVLILVRRGKL